MVGWLITKNNEKSHVKDKEKNSTYQVINSNNLQLRISLYKW